MNLIYRSGEWPGAVACLGVTAAGWGWGQTPRQGRTTAPTPTPTSELEILFMHQRKKRTRIAKSLFPGSLTHHLLSMNFLESWKYHSTARLVPLFVLFVSISITNLFKGFPAQPQKATSGWKLAYSFPVWEWTTLSSKTKRGLSLFSKGKALGGLKVNRSFYLYKAEYFE